MTAVPDIRRIARKLTAEHIEELDALAAINLAIGGPTFISRCQWVPMYRALVRKGLVKWGDPPSGFTKTRFAGAEITQIGLRVRDLHKVLSQ